MAEFSITISTDNPDADCVVREAVERLHALLSHDEVMYFDTTVTASGPGGMTVVAETCGADWNEWLEKVADLDPSVP